MPIGNQQVVQGAHGGDFGGQGGRKLGFTAAQGGEIGFGRSAGGAELGLAAGGAVGLQRDLRLEQRLLGQLEALAQAVAGQFGALEAQVSLVAL